MQKSLAATLLAASLALPLVTLPLTSNVAWAAGEKGGQPGKADNNHANGGAEWNWPADKEHMFYERMRTAHASAEGPMVDYSVGATIPSTVTLDESPGDFDFAPAREYRYVWAHDRVFVVNPKSRVVVRVIAR
jgi:hypothetical protein